MNQKSAKIIPKIDEPLISKEVYYKIANKQLLFYYFLKNNGFMSITRIVNNRQKFAYLHREKYAVLHKKRWHPLNKSDKTKVKIAAFIGAFFFASSFAERTARNYYRHQLKTKLRAKDEEEQRAHFKNQSIQMREHTEDLSKTTEHRLKRVPPHTKKIGASVHPLSERYGKLQVTIFTKQIGEPLSPTVKAALWRRSHLYR